MNKLKTFISLTKQIPINEYGLPTYLLNHSYLFNLDYSPDLTPELINSRLLHDDAIIELDYETGYPIEIKSGQPIWDVAGTSINTDITDINFRIPAIVKKEIEIESAFTRYIHMPYIVNNHTSDNGAIDLIGTYYQGGNYESYAYMRSLKHIAKNQEQLSYLYELATLNHWATKAKAYDYFCLAGDVQKRMHRKRMQENDQYHRVQALLRKATDLAHAMLDNPHLYEMSAADLIRLFGILSKQERTSVGLPESGPLSKESTEPQHIEIKSLLQKIATQPSNNNININNEDRKQLSAETIEKMQEIYFS